MHEYQERILTLLAHHEAVRFSDLERFFDLRSNKLSYHLNMLQDDELIEKDGDKYRLTGNGKVVAPYLGRELQPLPVVLVAPVHGDDILLVKREKEVYRDYYAIPSKTMAYGKTPEDTIQQLQKQYGLELEDIEYRKTVIEIDHAAQNRRQHHFIFLVYTATPLTTPDGTALFNRETLEQQDDIIPTDARIITTLEQDGLDVVGMDVSNGLELQDRQDTDPH